MIKCVLTYESLLLFSTSVVFPLNAKALKQFKSIYLLASFLLFLCILAILFICYKPYKTLLLLI